MQIGGLGVGEVGRVVRGSPPTLTILKLLLSVAAERDLSAMWLDVKCGFL